jgi:tRNA (guanine37-N1)-methyltransferase
MDALKYLKKNNDQNLPAILALERGAKPVVCEEGGVILYEAANDLYYISLDDSNLLSAWEYLKRTECLVLRENNIDAVAERIGVAVVNRCRQMIYRGAAPKPPKIMGLTIKRLSVADLGFVCAHYKMHLDAGYIEERLASGNVYGAYYNQRLAGFAGRHSDGSMGMLEVLPEFRRLGLGTALGCFLINLVITSGDIPYAHIFPNNEASLAMTGKLQGAAYTPELVAWVY